VTDTQRLTYLLPASKLIWINPSRNWYVVSSRPQILTNRYYINADSRKVSQASIYFLAGFAHS
jgi:hypothetical protein